MTCRRWRIPLVALAFVLGMIPLRAAVQETPVDCPGACRLGDPYDTFAAEWGDPGSECAWLTA